MAKHALASVEGFKKRREYFTVDPFKIIRSGILSRQNYGDQKDIDLKNDIAANGVKEPLKVQKNDDDNKLYLVNGSRRLWCCDRLKEEGIIIEAVPILLVDKKMSPSELLFEALSGNNSKDLTPLEEAEAFRKQRAYGISVKYIAERVGKSVPFVYDRLNLINASAETRDAIKKKEIGVTVASKAIASAGGDPDKQKRAIRKIVQRKNQARIQWSKKIGGLFFEGFEEKQKLFVDLFLSKDFTSKLDDMGFDPETLKITISKKGEPN